MKRITLQSGKEAWDTAAARLRGAGNVCALTGAGISVASGIPDFRSAGGLWSVYRPEEYATLDVFYRDPAKAWRLYRALGRIVHGKRANPAHEALAGLQEDGLLKAIITQNVDGLHQQAGSRNVLEIHGDHQRLQCLQCGELEAVREEHLTRETVPQCRRCASVLKPNVVLFGERVRMLEEIETVVANCGALLVAGTSAQVYPAASIPWSVKRKGGAIFEFNREPVLGTGGLAGGEAVTDYFFEGEVERTLPRLWRAVTGI